MTGPGELRHIIGRTITGGSPMRACYGIGGFNPGPPSDTDYDARELDPAVTPERVCRLCWDRFTGTITVRGDLHGVVPA